MQKAIPVLSDKGNQPVQCMRPTSHCFSNVRGQGVATDAVGPLESHGEFAALGSTVLCIKASMFQEISLEISLGVSHFCCVT